jgi:hypothetical protein
MKWRIQELILAFIFIFLIVFLVFLLYKNTENRKCALSAASRGRNKESFTNAVKKNTTTTYNVSYLETLEKHRNEGNHFPFRYTQDEKGQILPLVFVTAFFRDDKERTMFQEYIDNGIKVVGITAYKTFPKPITDVTGDSETSGDSFKYYDRINHWLSCFKNPMDYGLDPKIHHLANISESDFYDAEDESMRREKKYDIIYVCLNDTEGSCQMDGWNAINRNFKLALACLPILIEEMNLRVLIIGRENCGLEKLYGDRITIMGFLPYHEFQDKLRESRVLFVPNIYDASPRVVAESLIKGLPVLMNRSIVCGSKYVVPETGELFTDDNDIRHHARKLMERLSSMDTAAWWKQHYSRASSAKKMRNIIAGWFPNGAFDSVQEIYFR